MRLMITLLVLLAAVSTAPAQEKFFEGFEDIGPDQGAGPANLVQQGWIFRNQSLPGFDRRWVDGSTWSWPTWPAWEGQGFIGCKQRETVHHPGVGSNWMLLPAVSGQAAGDQIAFRFRGFPNWSEVIQLRYSPSGGTSTGSSPTDVGDFTGLLWEEDARHGEWNEPMDDEWWLIQIDLPGPGRLAFRFYAPSTTDSGSGSVWTLDDLEIGQNTEPPYPGPGETVHWTADMNPIPIPAPRTVVAGGTVIVDPGAHLVFEPGAEIDVQGQFHVRGTAGGIVRLDGNAQNKIGGVGSETYRFASVGIRLTGEAYDRCEFRDGSILGQPYPAIAHHDAVTVIEGCLFDGGALRPLGQVLLRNCVIRPPSDPFLNPFLLGFAVIENVRVEGVELELGTAGGQDMLVEGVGVIGNANGPGLELAGGRNYLIDESVQLQGNEVPVELGFDLAGILPGSLIPKTGNANNHIRDTRKTYNPRSFVYWANVGVPYVIEIARFVSGLVIEPGVVVQFKPNGNWTVSGRLEVEGLPNAPITFQRFDPASSFRGILKIDRLDWAILEGAETNGGTTSFWVTNSIIRNNDTGFHVPRGSAIYGRDNRFENNDVGISTDALVAGIRMNDSEQANSFEGNRLAIEHNAQASTADVRFNWWGDPSGPQIFDNPGGQGDAIGGDAAGSVDYVPFRTTPPDFEDHAPVVRVLSPSPILDEGTQVIFHWTAHDDGPIISQRISWTDNTQADGTFRVIASNLPPEQRSFEWTVQAPQIANPIYVRVEAFDEHGQIGFDDWSASVPVRLDNPHTATFLADLTQTFAPGERLDVCVDLQGGEGFADQGYLLLEADRKRISRGAVYQGCILAGVTMHDYSTNLARIAVAEDEGQGHWYFSDYFSIRYDPALGDAPPSVDMNFPTAGKRFPGGSTIPIRWDASDDDGELRRFDIQASYDGGRFWNDVVRDLPGKARGYDWKLPPSTGIPDVRVRVIAVDRRFQNTADGWERSFSITPGDEPIQPGAAGGPK